MLLNLLEKASIANIQIYHRDRCTPLAAETIRQVTRCGVMCQYSSGAKHRCGAAVEGGIGGGRIPNGPKTS